MNTGVFRERFREVYAGPGEVMLCRSPGRVNLIGEHMDYNGLPVLPMAIAQEIQMAFSPRTDSTVNLRNEDPEFQPVSFLNGPDIPPSPGGAWDNYCKAAVQGLNGHFHEERFPGMNLLVHSDLPIGRGLSSSSALVVSCALAYLAVLGKTLGEDLTRLELADLLAEAEQYVGTRGGGMDHAVILNGAPGRACKIDFFPLKVEMVPLPQACDIIVCDSLVRVEKSGPALGRFNAGPRLCALACALVERQVRDEFSEDIGLERLGELWYGPLCLTHQEAAAVCARAVPDDHTQAGRAADRLGCSAEDFRARWLEGLPPFHNGLPIQRRLRHALTEFQRVEAARDALLAADCEEFGRLMNASHESCANDFEVSSRELDALVACAREAGALGARLTGAGFGGATVNLVRKEDRARFVARVGETYYKDHRTYEGEIPIFAASASTGAGYL